MKKYQQNIIFLLLIFILFSLSCDDADPVKTKLYVICINDDIKNTSYYTLDGGSATYFSATKDSNDVAVFEAVFENVNDVYVQAISDSTSASALHVLLYKDSRYLDSELVKQNNHASSSVLNAIVDYQ